MTKEGSVFIGNGGFLKALELIRFLHPGNQACFLIRESKLLTFRLLNSKGLGRWDGRGSSKRAEAALPTHCGHPGAWDCAGVAGTPRGADPAS